MASKMHELLAAEANVVSVYNAMLEETFKVFEKPDHFIKATATKKHLDESEANLDTTETKDNTTTVDDRLVYYFCRSFANMFDLSMQMDTTNPSDNANPAAE